MARRPRYDLIGTIHHVYGRGIARRTVFERRRDVRYFLALLACEVRAGRIQVIAYSFLTTHFHLVVRSPKGDLAGVMRRVLNLYVRYFNRTRKRDGALFRGRYGSRPVLSRLYLRVLIHYVDRNAFQARLASSASRYPYASASHYASGRIPPWLRTVEVDELLGHPPEGERPSRYREQFERALPDAARRLVETRLSRAPSDGDDLDDLVAAAPDRVREWMIRKALLADNTLPGQSYSDPRTIDAVVARSDAPARWTCRPGRRTLAAAPIAWAGLLRDLGGFTFAEIAAHLECNESEVRRRIRQHRSALARDRAYADRVSVLARDCLEWLRRPGSAA